MAPGPAVWEARIELMELAGRLRAAEVRTQRALELAERLVTDGTGPLYAPTSPGDLRAALARVEDELRTGG